MQNKKSIKEMIKNITKKCPPLFIILKFLRWLPRDIKKFLYIHSGRILHPREVIHADIVLSVGNHCQAAHYMQEYNLRKFASPVDWMKYYSLSSLLELFKNDFKTFFINHYKDPIKAEDNGICRWLVDKNNGMIARHHFLKELPLEKQFDKFYQKQIRRFDKIKAYLKEADNIALVSCREDSMEDMEQFLLSFYTLYPKNITMINFRDDKTKEYKKVSQINEKLKIVEYCFDNTYPLKKNESIDSVGGIVWIGNYKKWGGGLRLIKLSKKIKYNKKEHLNDRY